MKCPECKVEAKVISSKIRKEHEKYDKLFSKEKN